MKSKSANVHLPPRYCTQDKLCPLMRGWKPTPCGGVLFGVIGVGVSEQNAQSKCLRSPFCSRMIPGRSCVDKAQDVMQWEPGAHGQGRREPGLSGASFPGAGACKSCIRLPVLPLTSKELRSPHSTLTVRLKLSNLKNQ